MYIGILELPLIGVLLGPRQHSLFRYLLQKLSVLMLASREKELALKLHIHPVVFLNLVGFSNVSNSHCFTISKALEEVISLIVKVSLTLKSPALYGKYNSYYNLELTPSQEDYFCKR